MLAQLRLQPLRNGLPACSTHFMRTPVGSVHAHHVPPSKVFFIPPSIYRTMASLAVKNCIFNRISVVRPDEHSQSVHGSSFDLKPPSQQLVNSHQFISCAMRRLIGSPALSKGAICHNCFLH